MVLEKNGSVIPNCVTKYYTESRENVTEGKIERTGYEEEDISIY